MVTTVSNLRWLPSSDASCILTATHETGPATSVADHRSGSLRPDGRSGLHGRISRDHRHATAGDLPRPRARAGMWHWPLATASWRSGGSATRRGPRYRSADARGSRRPGPPHAGAGLRRGTPVFFRPVRQRLLRVLYLARPGAVDGLRGGGAGAPARRRLGLHAPKLLHGLSRDTVASVSSARAPSSLVAPSRRGRRRGTGSE